MILVGTTKGLFGDEGGRLDLDPLAGAEITGLAAEGETIWALVEGRDVWRLSGRGGSRRVGGLEGPVGTCLGVTPAGVLVGTEGAHLWRLRDGLLRPVESFERVEGRERWYTPWGDPADVRSISSGPDGAVYVNVHVGGVVRSADGGATWQPTVDIETDVHQVLAHAQQPGLVLVAAAIGFGWSLDGGATWRFDSRGLHATYLRAVAVAGADVLVSASTGPSTRRAALYRRPLGDDAPFTRCDGDLPEWFPSNIDTGCLAARDGLVAFGTAQGDLWVSEDGGRHWRRAARDLAPVRAVVVV